MRSISSSFLCALSAASALLLAAPSARADFIINSGTSLTFSDQPGQGANDGGDLLVQDGTNSPTSVTFASPGYIGGNLSVTGGSAVTLPATLDSTLPFFVVGGNLSAYDQSTVLIAGAYAYGAVGGNLYAYDSSTVTVAQSATINGDINGTDLSVTDISGGMVFGSVYASGSSTVNLLGGSISGSVYLNDTSTLSVYGAVSVSGSNGDFTLFGTLADGTDLGPNGLEVFAGSPGQIDLVTTVPAPPSVVLLGIGSLILLGWRGCGRLRHHEATA